MEFGSTSRTEYSLLYSTGIVFAQVTQRRSTSHFLIYLCQWITTYNFNLNSFRTNATTIT